MAVREVTRPLRRNTRCREILEHFPAGTAWAKAERYKPLAELLEEADRKESGSDEDPIMVTVKRFSSRLSVTSPGRFAAELIVLIGLPTYGLTVNQLALGFMTLIIIAFIYINYRGASETAAVGNILGMFRLGLITSSPD